MEKEIKKIELLVPARNLETGIVAVNNGADAVYIGAHRFGARQMAGNSVEDIKQLVDYAHLFNVKVYVTLNTIVEEEDINAVEELIAELYEIGVDALIVQDLGILKMNIPPLQLHASTQTDNRTVEKVRFIADAGFPRVVLARELSLKEIAEIHAAVPQTELEVFVHGALCVSYSGQCYASQHCFGRSANKGACAQFCRLPFDLVDADGKIIGKQKHFLSLKDMNRSDYLEQMMDAGVTSFKIEGRLKDVSYVKNVTAYYRAKLDAILLRRTEYRRSSYGTTSPNFVPAPEKSFSRGFTDYLLVGDKEGITSFDTPKSLGENMGQVRVVARNFFTMQGCVEFANGDGVCFIGADGKLQGFRINKVEGGRIFPQSMPALFPGVTLYRNSDSQFEKQLSRPDNPRKLSLELCFSDSADGFVLYGRDESGVDASVEVVFAKDVARNSQRDNIINQLGKWGGTPFETSCIKVELSGEWFVPSSLLSTIRRDLCDKLIEKHRSGYVREEMSMPRTSHKYPIAKLDYRGNVSNSLAMAFYKEHGVEDIQPAYEVSPVDGATIMYCKHCIKHSFGWCSKSGNRSPYREPFYLVSSDGKRFSLAFDCKQCIMMVNAE